MRLASGSTVWMLACALSLSLLGVYSASCSGDKEAEGAELSGDGTEVEATTEGSEEKKEKKAKKGKNHKKDKKKKKK